MKLSLRVRLLGVIIGVVAFVFLCSFVASRFVLARDLTALGRSEVTGASNALGGYIDARRQQIQLLVANAALSDTVRSGLQRHAIAALQSQLSDTATTSGLSFLTVVDAQGRVIASVAGNGGGSIAGDPVVARALNGETVSTITVLAPVVLNAEGLAPQAQTDVHAPDGTVIGRIGKGLALAAAAPVNDDQGRTAGVVYGGILMNHYYDIVDAAARTAGGSAALLDGNVIVSSTIQAPDGTRFVDQRIDAVRSVLQTGQPFIGSDTEGGTTYFARIDPLSTDQGTIVGAQWYGVPMSQITGILGHTITALVLWGLAAVIVALAFAIPIIQALSNTLADHSRKVRRAAKELGVTIVGSEVSGDHVSATKATVERSGVLIDELAKSGDSTGNIAELKSLNTELKGDVTVIETLAHEMSSHMQQAVERVSELNSVAGELNELVTGEQNA